MAGFEVSSRQDERLNGGEFVRAVKGYGHSLPFGVGLARRDDGGKGVGAFCQAEFIEDYFADRRVNLGNCAAVRIDLDGSGHPLGHGEFDFLHRLSEQVAAFRDEEAQVMQKGRHPELHQGGIIHRKTWLYCCEGTM